MTETAARRVPYLDKAFPEVAAAMEEVTRRLKPVYEQVGLPASLIELVCLRASQMNRCGTCLSVHVPRALQAGVSQLQIDVLPSWREDTELFTPQEKAALELTEHITKLPEGIRNSSVGERAQTFFTEAQVAALEWCAIMINANNRISIASHHPIRKYPQVSS